MITLKTVRYFTLDGQEMANLTQMVQDTIESYLGDNFDMDYEPTPEEMHAIIRAIADYTEV